MPHQVLEASEVDAFLEYTFGDVAKRPRTLRLRESAGVVRYLRLLALKGIPTEVANRGEDAIRQYQRSRRDEQAWYAEKVAEIIWLELGITGNVRPSARQETLDFLQKHSEGYFSFYAKPAIDFVQRFQLPRDCTYPFRPSLKARHMSVPGGTNPRLQNDLSERIYATHHAMRRAGFRGSRLRIADTLEKLGVQASRRSKRDGAIWTEHDVNQRVKQYEKQLQKKLREPLESQGETLSDQRLDTLLQARRDGLADKWISHWRWDLFVEQRRASEQL